MTETLFLLFAKWPSLTKAQRLQLLRQTEGFLHQRPAAEPALQADHVMQLISQIFGAAGFRIGHPKKNPIPDLLP